ncbi:hypothetical protein R2083_07445 [Nitrosomonas sp. Is35]|uniref:hypothetical protein n=1 Tax=Nitrosomonas sp. Is35 TaxID=3080534 RepID=UPI00294B5395|nr:hypothetical protein [Nitrosomonas sp. Is35]MDV6347347.1 hypothetical protein [Nitrosomonas sp. Is35]
MRLIYQRDYRSIAQFEPIELQPFSVLTGINGAGKSHLLEAIENGSIYIEGILPNQPNQPNENKQIRLFSWGGLYPQSAGLFASSQVATEQSNYWNSLNAIRSDLLETLASRLDQLNIPLLKIIKNELIPKL